MSTTAEATTVPAPTGAQTGAKMFFTVAGMGTGWYLHQTGLIQDVGADGKMSFKAPIRFKTTYLLYATAALGYVAGSVIGNAIYGEKKKKSKN